MDIMKSAPVEPGVGVGVFKLKKHINDYFDVILQYNFQKFNPLEEDYSSHGYLKSPFEIVYRFGTFIEVSFHSFNGKLMRIVVQNDFKGKLDDNIVVGMDLDKVRNGTWYYDNDDECYRSPQLSGVEITADPYFKFVESISVYIPEMDALKMGDSAQKFMLGKW